MVKDNSTLKVPSYNELIYQVTTLADQVHLLQTATPVPSAPSVMLSPVVDYRITELTEPF